MIRDIGTEVLILGKIFFQNLCRNIFTSHTGETNSISLNCFFL